MVHKPDVAVVVDSCSCLPQELVDGLPLFVVPHELTVSGRTFRDGVDIHPDEFYRLVRASPAPPTTASPRPAAFLEAFRQASQSAKDVLCLTLSINFSSTYDSARAAARMAGSEMPHLNVQVIDSRAAAGAEGLIALNAARAAHQGADILQVISVVEELIPEVNMLAFLDTLDYLRRSGRVPLVAAWAGSILGIKPLTELRLGEAKLLDKPRSRSKAMERLAAVMKSRVGSKPVHVNVMHAHSAEDADKLLKRMDQEFDCRELFMSEFTPVMGAHLGPGLIGAAFYTDES